MKDNEKTAIQPDKSGLKDEFEGYPVYPEEEDIYSKCKEEKNIDPEDISKLKEIEIIGSVNEKDFEEDVTGGDLDIPGTELDEEVEITALEDEENNYFSLGADDHVDLEENLE